MKKVLKKMRYLLSFVIILISITVFAKENMAYAVSCNNHNWSDATCFAPKTCKNYGCGATTGSPKGHTWQAATCKAPKTCTACGFTEGSRAAHVAVTGATCTNPSVCRTCGTVLQAALSHAPGAAATCTTPQTCTRSGCGVIIKPASHTPGSTATCTKAQKCKSCGATIKAALGHDWSAATCYASKTCKRKGCNETEGTALGHDWQAATCKAPKTCTRCKTIDGNKAAHVPLTGATCTNPSVCRTCGTVLNEALGHAPGAEATCTTAQKCTRSGCGATLVEALDHVPGATATCTTAQKCTRSGCGATIKAALGHDWSDATCFAPKTCKRTGCGATEGSPKGHTWQAATCKAPKTCTACGFTEGGKTDHVALTGATCTAASVCRTCGTVLQAALGHNPGAAATCTSAQKCTRYGCGVIIKDALGHVPGATATCTTAQKCTRSGCGATIKEALGHDWSDATCFAPATCKRTGCGATSGSPKGHTWQAATCKAPKTCTACGYKEGGLADHVALTGATCTTASVCRTCGITLHEALGHEPGPEATCTTVQKCTRYGCGKVLADKKPHKYETITIAPGCLTPGLEQEKCACGNVKSSKEVPALGHNWKDWEVIKEATCEQDGERKHTCKRCYITVYETIDKLGHEYSNGICTRCKKYENYEGIKVTFDANGGVGGQYINAISVIPGETYGKLPVGPTRAGYTFDGWYTAKSGGTKVTASTKVTKTTAHTLYAHWTAGKYTIEFNGNGSTSGSMSSITVKFGEKTKLPKNTYKNGEYLFAGWNEKKDGTGKGYLDETSVENLTTVNNGKITLYAQWIEGSYMIHYDANGGTGAPPSQKATIGKTGNLSGRKPTRDGYEFMGWSLSYYDNEPYKVGESFPNESDSSSVNMMAKSNGEVTLHAIWAEKVYTVTFHPNGGEGKVEDVTVFSDGKVSYIPKYTREGYELVGWGRSAGEGRPELDIITYPLGEDIIVDGNMNLYAKWKVQTYEITYNLHGGTPSTINPTTANTGKTVKLSSVIPTKKGFDFLGWSLAEGALTGDYQPGDSFPKSKDSMTDIENTQDLTLHAIWGLTEYTITFYPNGGEGVSVPKTVARGSRVFDVPEYTRPGYEFIGWGRSEGEGRPELDIITYPAGEEIIATESMNLYAKWTKVSYYVIEYDLMGGSFEKKVDNLSIKFGQKGRISDSVPVRDGYTFAGWSLEFYAEEVYETGEQFPSEKDAKVIESMISSNGDKIVRLPLFARWTENELVTVKFMRNDGTDKVVSKKDYLKGIEIGALQLFDRPGYNHIGWSEDKDSNKATYGVTDKIRVSKEMTLYAVWEKIPNPIVTLDYNNGAEAEVKEYEWGEIVYLPADIEKEGYVLKGWSRSDNINAKPEYTPDDTFYARTNTTLHAVWGKKVTVTFVYGTVNDVPVSTYIGGKVTMLASDKVSMKALLGWKDNSTGNTYRIGEKIEVFNDMTLHAQWSEKKMLHYHLNGGSSSVPILSEEFEFDKPIDITITEPERTFYKFLGWTGFADSKIASTIYSHANGNSKFPCEGDIDYDAYKEMKNITLYAQWREIADYKTILELQKTYGKQNLPDKIFLEEGMSDAWASYRNTAYGVYKTWTEPYDEIDYYYSEVYVMEKTPTGIQFKVYSPNVSLSTLFELRILQEHSNVGGVALVSGIRVLKEALGVAADAAVTVLLPGGKAILLGRDIYEMLNDVQAFYEYCLDPSASNDKVIINGTGLTIGGVSLTQTEVEVLKGIVEGELIEFLKPGESLAEEFLSGIDELTIAGLLLDLCDFWASVGRSCYEEVDPNGGLDEVAGYYVDMLKDSSFGEGVTSEVGSILTSLYNASYSSTNHIKSASAMAENEVRQVSNGASNAFGALAGVFGN